MTLSLIAAMSENRVIGIQNRLPWNLPEDLKRFKRLTSGHPVIMGRKTFESIGRPLPNRENIVISRQPGLAIAGVRSAISLEAAIEMAQERTEKSQTEIFVIGGAEIYQLALPLAERLYLTIIQKSFEGDATFPDWEAQGRWNILERTENRDGDLEFHYLTLQRAPKKATAKL